MSEPITPEISDRICKHMNEDHPEANVLYAKVYGNASLVSSAIMNSIDPQGMNLAVNTGETTVDVRVNFDHVLKDAEDAHHTLVAMLKQARTPATDK